MSTQTSVVEVAAICAAAASASSRRSSPSCATGVPTPAPTRPGSSQTAYPPNVRVVRVMCTGRVDPQFVLKAYDEGADGVLILGCHPGDCHYKEQNYRMIQRHRLLLNLLQRARGSRGEVPARLRVRGRRGEVRPGDLGDGRDDQAVGSYQSSPAEFQQTIARGGSKRWRPFS